MTHTDVSGHILDVSGHLQYVSMLYIRMSTTHQYVNSDYIQLSNTTHTELILTHSRIPNKSHTSLDWLHILSLTYSHICSTQFSSSSDSTSCSSPTHWPADNNSSMLESLCIDVVSSSRFDQIVSSNIIIPKT